MKSITIGPYMFHISTPPTKGEYIIASSEDHSPVAKIPSDWKNAAGNARLLSAAYDLLTAVEGVEEIAIDMVANYYESHDRASAKPWEALIRALAKAKGVSE